MIFFPNMTFVPYFKGFPTITHTTFLDLPFGSFEDLSIHVHFGISCYNLVCKLIPSKLLMQFHFN